jgi:hypothetical protein
MVKLLILDAEGELLMFDELFSRNVVSYFKILVKIFYITIKHQSHDFS